MILARHPWHEPFSGWGSQHLSPGLPYKRKDFFKPKQLTTREILTAKKAPNGRARDSKDAFLTPKSAANGLQDNEPQVPERGVRASIGSASGIPRMTFQYTYGNERRRYTLQCDLGSVDIHALSDLFKQENSVYPLARGAKSKSFPDAVRHLAQCNLAGWALAKLNPFIQGKRDLIFHAVESWLEEDPSKLSTQFSHHDLEELSRPRTHEKESVLEPDIRGETGTTSRNNDWLTASSDSSAVETKEHAANERPVEGGPSMAQSSVREEKATLDSLIYDFLPGEETISTGAEIEALLLDDSTLQVDSGIPQPVSRALEVSSLIDSEREMQGRGDIDGAEQGTSARVASDLSCVDSGATFPITTSSETRQVKRGGNDLNHEADATCKRQIEACKTQHSAKIQDRTRHEVVLEQIMHFFTLWLDSKLAVVTCSPSRVEGSKSSPSSENTNKGSEKPCSSGRQKPPNSRKRKRQQLPGGDESENDTSEENEQGTGGWVQRNDNASKFACPFFKHDRKKYRGERNCCGPGWPTVHRVK